MSPEDSAKIEVGHGVVGLEPDRLTVGRDGLVQLPLGLQGEDEAGVGLSVVGLEPDRLAVGRDGLVQLSLVFQGGAECEAVRARRTAGYRAIASSTETM